MSQIGNNVCSCGCNDFNRVKGSVIGSYFECNDCGKKYEMGANDTLVEKGCKPKPKPKPKEVE